MSEDANYFEERIEGSANPFIEVYGVSYSPNCESEMSITANSIYFDDYYRKALNYVVVMSIFTFFEVVVFLDQIEFTNSDTVKKKKKLFFIFIFYFIFYFILFSYFIYFLFYFIFSPFLKFLSLLLVNKLFLILIYVYYISLLDL